MSLKKKKESIQEQLLPERDKLANSLSDSIWRLLSEWSNEIEMTEKVCLAIDNLVEVAVAAVYSPNDEDNDEPDLVDLFENMDVFDNDGEFYG